MADEVQVNDSGNENQIKTDYTHIDIDFVPNKMSHLSPISNQKAYLDEQRKSLELNGSLLCSNNPAAAGLLDATGNERFSFQNALKTKFSSTPMKVQEITGYSTNGPMMGNFAYSTSCGLTDSSHLSLGSYASTKLHFSEALENSYPQFSRPSTDSGLPTISSNFLAYATPQSADSQSVFSMMLNSGHHHAHKLNEEINSVSHFLPDLNSSQPSMYMAPCNVNMAGHNSLALSYASDQAAAMQNNPFVQNMHMESGNNYEEQNYELCSQTIGNQGKGSTSHNIESILVSSTPQNSGFCYVENEEELNTKELAQKISGELKRYSIPQSVFAQRILCRSQGTLSDLLRNPKPWSKLKSGRETFRRMYKWLQEPEFQRIAALRMTSKAGGFNCGEMNWDNSMSQGKCILPLGNGKSDDVTLSRGPLYASSSSPRKPRLVFTELQRCTLQSIFKETRRPSKEMQANIAKQLGLEVNTVANFFMNSRRRAIDKWPKSCMDKQKELGDYSTNNGSGTSAMLTSDTMKQIVNIGSGENLQDQDTGGHLKEDSQPMVDAMKYTDTFRSSWSDINIIKPYAMDQYHQNYSTQAGIQFSNQFATRPYQQHSSMSAEMMQVANLHQMLPQPYPTSHMATMISANPTYMPVFHQNMIMNSSYNKMNGKGMDITGQEHATLVSSICHNNYAPTSTGEEGGQN